MCFVYWISPLSRFALCKVFAGIFCFQNPGMTYIIRQGCLFVMLCFAGRTVSACRSLYPDLCGYNGNENNATESEDYDVVIICDCQQVMFCSVVELTEECNSVKISFNTSDNSSISTCDVSPLDSQANAPVYKILKIRENEFVVEVFTEFSFGKHKVVCSVPEIENEFDVIGNTQWDIISINPVSVTTDLELKVRLTVARDTQTVSTSVWCFVKTPDDSMQILSASWVSASELDCLGFRADVPGEFRVSLSSSMTSDIFEKAAILKATSKRPVVQEARFDYNFESIFIYFDENIEIHSKNCANLFSQDSLRNFGVGFDCNTRGNALVVKMGSNFKIPSEVAITGGSKICRAGSQNAEFCLLDSAVTLSVLRPSLSGPNLSFNIEAACATGTSRKYMSVKTQPPGRRNPVGNAKPPYKTTGKLQRRNLMTWRTMRRFQSKLSSRNIVLLLNATDVEPLFENFPSVDDLLDGSDGFGSKASVSVFLQSSPGTVLAEADVTFCKDYETLFLYKWTVNGREAAEGGKLLLLKDLDPGKYLVKSVVVRYNSTEVLGQGWATAEIPSGEEKIIIIPTEITVGTTDEIFLRAVTWYGSSTSWTCRTSANTNCFTADQKSVTDVVDSNSPNITISAGTLPAGRYVWKAETARGSAVAKVFVKDGNAPAVVAVDIPSTFPQPSRKDIMWGTVGRTQKGCRAWWSSVREKGFDYFPFNTVEVNADASTPRKEIPLLIPSNSQIWGRGQPSSLYLFQLQLFCPPTANQNGSFEYLKAPLIVSNPPRVSPVTVQPLTGDAMITKFTITSREADAPADDHPLSYEWSYVDACSAVVPISRGAFFRNLTTYLPPGDVRLILKVCNWRKSCATSSTETIKVIQAFHFPAENFHNARNEIRHLMTRGESLEAFGLATTVFKSLALLAEGEVREAVFATVDEAIRKKIEELKGKLLSDRKHLEECLEFYERASAVAKFFRKNSNVSNRLTEFRNSFLGT